MNHPIIKKSLKALPKNAPVGLKSFIEEFFSKVPKDELDSLSAKEAIKIAENHYRLTRERKPGADLIHIHTPEESWGHGNTIIDIVQDDMAFLIDSVVTEIVRQKYAISFLIHPILRLERDKKGSVKSVSADKDKSGEPQSHIHIQLQNILTPKQIENLEAGILKVLHDVDYATADWLTMRKKLRDAQRVLSEAPKRYDDSLIEEYQAFLEYLHDNNFTLLGFREYSFSEKDGNLTSKIVKGSSLGLLREEISPVYVNEARTGLTQQQQKMRRNQDPLTIAKVNKRSTVHRRVPLDAIAVKKFDKKGKVSGEILFIGLFTSVTYSRSVGDIPYLRRKVTNTLLRSDYEYQSHDFKALKHILEKYPRDELFQIEEDDLYDHVTSILRLQERPRIALYMRTDPFGRYISCLTYVPRELYDTRLRLKFIKILEESLGGNCVNFKVTQDDSPLARVIFFVNINHLDKVPDYDVSLIESKLIRAGRIWSQNLHTALENTKRKDAVIAQIVEDFGQAFPINYQERYSIEESIHDIGFNIVGNLKLIKRSWEIMIWIGYLYLIL